MDQQATVGPDGQVPSRKGRITARGPGTAPVSAPAAPARLARALLPLGFLVLGLAAPPRHAVAYWIVAACHGAVTGLLLFARRDGPSLPRLLLVLDVLVVVALVLLRGPHEAGVTAGYLALVLFTSAAERGTAWWEGAALVALAWCVLVAWHDGPGRLLGGAHALQIVLFFALAVFASRLAGVVELEQAGRHVAEARLRSASLELRQSAGRLKRAREALRANDRLTTLGMLSAGLGHELRNPLAAVVNSLEPIEDIVGELRASFAAGEPCEDLLGELVSIAADSRLACGQLQRLANDLTAVAGGAVLTAVPVDPEEVVDGALRMLQARLRRGFDVERRCSTSQRILADPGRLLQILINLITNALDAMEPDGGGAIRLIVASAGSQAVDITVEDTGPGIPADVATHMFEPFFSTKGAGKGTGLGLHVVSEIVKALRGAIRHESAGARGARFVVTLPAVRKEESDEGVQDQGDDRRRRGADPRRLGAHASA